MRKFLHSSASLAHSVEAVYKRIFPNEKSFVSRPKLFHSINSKVNSKAGAWYIASGIAFLYVLFFLIGFIFPNALWFNAQEITSYLQVLLQVHTGVLSVTFVVVVLFVDGLGTRNNRSESLIRLFLQHLSLISTVFFGLCTAASLAFISIPVGKIFLNATQVSLWATLNIALFMCNLILTGHLYWRAYQSLTYGFWDKIVIEHFHNWVDGQTKTLLKEHIGITSLKEHFETLGINTQKDWRDKAARIDVQDTAVIVNIDTSKLELMLRRAVATSEHSPRLQISKSIGSKVTSYDNIFGYLSTDLDNEEFRKALNAGVVLVPIKSELNVPSAPRYLQEQIQEAASTESERRLTTLLQSYVDAVNEIIDTETRCKAIITDSQDNTLWLSKCLYALQSDYREVILGCLRTNNPNALSNLISTPTQILLNAITKDNVIAFQAFSEVIVWLYQSLESIEDSRVRKSMEEVLWDYVRRVFYFSLDAWGPTWNKRQPSLEDEIRLGKFANHALLVMNKMLKQSINSNNIDGFHKVSNLIDNVYKKINEKSDNYYYYEHLALVDYQKGAEAITNEIGNLHKIDGITKIIKVSSEIRSLRHVIWFGIGALLVKLLASKSIKSEIFVELYKVVLTHFPNIISLNRSYQDAQQETRLYRDRLNWISWTFEAHEPQFIPEATLTPLDEGSRLDLFYCLAGVAITPIDVDPEFRLPNNDVTYHSPGTLRNTLDKIKTNLSLWQEYLPTTELERRMNNFLEIHDKALAEQKRLHEETLISAPIDVEKTNLFVRTFLEEWQRTAVLRNIFRAHGKVEDLTSYSSPDWDYITPRGVDQFAPKDLFTGNEGRHVVELSKFYATSFTRLEERIFCSSLENQQEATIIDVPILDDIVAYIGRAIEQMTTAGYSPTAIWINYLMYIQLVKAPEFTLKREEGEDDGVQGYYKGIGIYVLKSNESAVYVVDTACAGIFVQLYLSQSPKQPFWIDISPNSVNEIQEWFAKDENWIKDAEGNPLNKEQIELKVREKQQEVRIRIYERLAFLVDDPRSYIVLKHKVAD